jgi:hypothetical protein
MLTVGSSWVIVIQLDFEFISEVMLAAVKQIVHVNNIKLPSYAHSWFIFFLEQWWYSDWFKIAGALVPEKKNDTLGSFCGHSLKLIRQSKSVSAGITDCCWPLHKYFEVLHSSLLFLTSK